MRIISSKESWFQEEEKPGQQRSNAREADEQQRQSGGPAVAPSSTTLKLFQKWAAPERGTQRQGQASGAGPVSTCSRPRQRTPAIAAAVHAGTRTPIAQDPAGRRTSSGAGGRTGHLLPQAGALCSCFLVSGRCLGTARVRGHPLSSCRQTLFFSKQQRGALDGQ